MLTDDKRKDEIIESVAALIREKPAEDITEDLLPQLLSMLRQEVSCFVVCYRVQV